MTTTIPATNGIRYPVFMPNQVLTHKDLNGLVSYLSNQEHLTRTYLIGMGIVCGMDATPILDGQRASIQVTAGCGLTSEGHLIVLPEMISDDTKLTQYKELTAEQDKVSERLFFGETAEEKTYSVVELFNKSATDGQPITAEILTDQVLVVVYESQDEQQDVCLLDADNRGVTRSFRLRFFLLPSTSASAGEGELSAEYLLRKGYQLDQEGQLPERWQDFDAQNGTEAVFTARSTFLSEFMPRVQRFGWAEDKKTVDLTKIDNYEDFLQNYCACCSKIIEEIGNTFPELFQLFSPFFTLFQPDSEQHFQDLLEKELLNPLILHLEAIMPETLRTKTVPPEKVETPYALQYFYDYLSQLVAAFEELAAAAFDLMDDCLPSTQRFPRFLMLGPLSGADDGAPSAYRHHFTQPPLYNGNSLRVAQVRHLYTRLVNLCQADSFVLPPTGTETPLKITPSTDRSQPLSQQAIPYYLNPAKRELYDHWNFDADRKGRHTSHPAYFLPGGELSDNTLLLQRLDAYNFYRIEGHIGQSADLILDKIRNERRNYELPFDLIPLLLGGQAELDQLDFSGQIDDLEADFEQAKCFWKLSSNNGNNTGHSEEIDNA